jgi:REP element-mobilizing transposase RayT
MQHRRGYQLPDPVKKLEASARMIEHACRLNGDQRRIVETAIEAHCNLREWVLHAVNCRSNHLHVVLTAHEHPDEVRRQLKAWCTRKLKEFVRESPTTGSGANSSVRTRWWAERGSRRYLNDEKSLEAAILYVRDGQDLVR